MGAHPRFPAQNSERSGTHLAADSGQPSSFSPSRSDASPPRPAVGATIRRPVDASPPIITSSTCPAEPCPAEPFAKALRRDGVDRSEVDRVATKRLSVCMYPHALPCHSTAHGRRRMERRGVAETLLLRLLQELCPPTGPESGRNGPEQYFSRRPLRCRAAAAPSLRAGGAEWTDMMSCDPQ